MSWLQIPKQFINRLRRKGGTQKHTHSPENNGKTLNYTVVLELANYQANTAEIIKKLILENPWSTISAPQLNFETLEGKTMVSISFQTFNDEKAKQIENQLKKFLQ